MTTPRLSARRRWLVGGLAALVIVVFAVWFVRSVVLQDSARAVPTDQVVDDFRATETTAPTDTTVAPAPTTTPVTTAPATAPPTSVMETGTPPSPPSTVPAPPTLVAPGVYQYRTTGSESIDALGGTTHDYPAETTITVTSDGCGVHLRWDALVERRDEWGLCATTAGIELQRDGVQYHEFYSQPDEEAVACDRTVVLVPTGTAPAPVTQTCTLASDPWLPTWEVLERTTRTVAGVDVPVQHVRMTIDDTDEYYEHTTIDWYLADDGLPVDVTGTKESSSPSPVGAVLYQEDYRLELISLDPLL